MGAFENQAQCYMYKVMAILLTTYFENRESQLPKYPLFMIDDHIRKR